MAGSMSGAKLMALSLKRAGSNWIEATGCPGTIAGKAGFNSAGTKRAGDTFVPATGQMGYDGKCPTMGKGSKKGRK
jgi:hypothetical protein